VTTNNSHFEQSDVQTTLAEYVLVSETATETSTTLPSDTVTPLPEAQTHTDGPVEASLLETQREPAPELAADEPIEATLLETQREPAPVQETSPETSSAISSTATEPEVAEIEAEQQSTPEVTVVAEQEQIAPVVTAVDIQAETENVTAEPAAVQPSEETPQQTEEVRPFTDFIKEFRQSEARFNASVQIYQAESFTNIIEDTAIEAPSDITTEPTQTDETPVVELPGASQDHLQTTPSTVEAATPDEPATPLVRPISPLLRPASRLRLPRHGVARHREEPSVEKVIPPAQPEPPQEEEETRIEPSAAEPTPAFPAEPPRPARRYRFDRPATTATSTTNGPSAPVATPNQPVQPRPEPTRAESTQVSTEREVQPSQSPQTKAAAEPQQPAVKQPVAQEVTEGESTTITAVPEHGRRRHGQKGKEQTTPAQPVAPASTDETAAVTAATEEIATEDLPPLEYSELQKANSRRRRRRHTPPASTPVAAKPNTPETPVVPAIPTVAPGVVAPRTSATPYTITSGYTVSQMNQDGTGPFMGPDPSPAPGSLAAQNVRSIRTDAQRTPVYPVRTTEATSASVHQLANIVSQAIQTQTDRMVAELRSANQSPTNISVSMPQLPSNERVGVFVDVANLLYSARTLRITVDFGKLLDFLRGNRRLVRAHAYCPTSPQPGDEQMFLQAVKGLGYRITTKNYKTFASGAKKADLDLDLCMDVVRLVDGKAVDCIVLVSGDSDFMPMLDYCSDHGVRVEVAAFDEAMSGTLRQSCDLFINLGMLEDIRA
jgi:uncharacterized LabA/DUF88 family protein